MSSGRSSRGAQLRLSLFMVAAWSGALVLWASGLAAQAAERAIVHRVGPGETLASIAELYYGDARRESVLVAENGLTSEGGSSIVVGLRLLVPTVSYYKVETAESWPSLATRFYGDPTRAFALIEANGATAGISPDPGAELVIPYPLRHVAAQADNLRKLAKTYFPRGPNEGATAIRRFNQIDKGRISRGQILLVPLSDLSLSPKGKQLVAALADESSSEGALREKQARVEEQLPALRAHVREGRYADAVAVANRLIGGGDLTGSQTLTIHRELAEAMVALGRNDLAVEALLQVLEQQPDAQLDGVTTSPKVLSAFAEAQRAHRRGDKGASAPRAKKLKKKAKD